MKHFKKGKSNNEVQNNIFDKFFPCYRMQAKLIIKNFGPIVDVNMVLKNVNVLIGPQASGKSTIAKVFTIFKSPRKYFKSSLELDNPKLEFTNVYSKEDIQNVFEEFNLKPFLKSDTFIEYDSEVHFIKYENEEITYEPKLRLKALELFFLANQIDKENNRDILASKLYSTSQLFFIFGLDCERIIYGDLKKEDRLTLGDLNNLPQEKYIAIIKLLEETEKYLSSKPSLYIPAERVLSSIIKKSALNLIVNDVPIPKHILLFGAELEKLESIAKEIDLNFLSENLKYKVVDGNELIYFSDNESINLIEASSGIQSVLPILQSTSGIKGNAHRSLVIEEPEMNLFPLAQYELIKLLESKRNTPPIRMNEDFGTIHTYTTHSPYILSSINNLLYAHKVRDKILNASRNSGDDFMKRYSDANLKVSEVISAKIDPGSFTAYEVFNGTVGSIFNTETGLIEDNYIDKATDKINDDFDNLMELIR